MAEGHTRLGTSSGDLAGGEEEAEESEFQLHDVEICRERILVLLGKLSGLSVLSGRTKD